MTTDLDAFTDSLAAIRLRIEDLGPEAVELPMRGELMHHLEAAAEGLRVANEQLRVERGKIDRILDELETEAHDLKRAMLSRATIDQAKGIVMAHRRISPDQALTHLMSLCSNRHAQLRDIAREIVDRASRAHSR